MRNMQCIEPIVGNWYRSHGLRFEVVALDDTERLVEIQHADGDLEEMELDDWVTRCRAGSLAEAGAPEDARLATDHEDEDDTGVALQSVEDLQELRADALGDLDLFD